MVPGNDKVIADRSAIIEVLKDELRSRLNLPYEPEDLHEDASLLGAGLGLDSLDALEIVLCIEDRFGVSIPDDSVSALRSINTIVDFILAERERSGGGRKEL